MLFVLYLSFLMYIYIYVYDVIVFPYLSHTYDLYIDTYTHYYTITFSINYKQRHNEM